MANQLKMGMVQSILTLRERRWSFRRIARTLGVHRETVSRYVRAAEASKSANAPTGSADTEAEALGGLRVSAHHSHRSGCGVGARPGTPAG